MGWKSETLAIASERKQLESLWDCVLETYANAKEVQHADEREDRLKRALPTDPFCCFFLRGRCGLRSCDFSHRGPVNSESISRRGCNKSRRCTVGHNDNKNVGFQHPSPAFDIEDQVRSYTFAEQLSQQGPDYSVDDPLWMEASDALRSLKSVCVEEFEPPEDDYQRVTWMICNEPILLLQSLDPDYHSEMQKKAARSLLAIVQHLHVQIFRKRWPWRAQTLCQAAAASCASLPCDLPTPGAPRIEWNSLLVSLVQCGNDIENFRRACLEDDEDTDDEDDIFNHSFDFAGSRMEHCSKDAAKEIKELWQSVQDAHGAISRLPASATSPAKVDTSISASVGMVLEWLEAEGFGEHVPRFRHERIDVQELRLLKEDHLFKLGVVRLGDRLSLIQAISLRSPPLPSKGRSPEARPAVARSPVLNQSPPKSFVEVVRRAAQLRDGAIMVRHWVPGGIWSDD